MMKQIHLLFFVMILMGSLAPLWGQESRAKTGDIRFPELYREYRKLDVGLIFQSFYNARQKPGGIHPKIMPVTAQARAATNHFYMSLANPSAPASWPCHFITPDGLIGQKLEPDTPGILISTNRKLRAQRAT